MMKTNQPGQASTSERLGTLTAMAVLELGGHSLEYVKRRPREFPLNSAAMNVFSQIDQFDKKINALLNKAGVPKASEVKIQE